MKICILSGTYHPDVGGPPTYLLGLAEALVHQGHDINVVTYGDSHCQYPYRVTRVPRSLPAPARMALFALETLRQARGAQLLFVNDYGLPPTVANLLLHKPIVMKIVGDFAWEYSLRHALVPAGLGIEEFQQSHFGPTVESLRSLQSWYARSADLVITPSEYLARIVAGWGVPGEKLRVVFNAPTPILLAGPSGQRPSALAAFSSSHFLVSTVARLAPWKGVDVLIRAVAEARSRVTNLRLVVVGDGEERSKLEHLAAPLGETVHFVGDVSREVAVSIMQHSSLLALCSAYEGFSHVLLEAMQQALPVVATAVGGNPELVRDGQNGLLVPYGDVTALAHAIVRLARDHDLAMRLGRQASVDAQSRSWPSLVDETVAAFQEVLETKRTVAA